MTLENTQMYKVYQRVLAAFVIVAADDDNNNGLLAAAGDDNNAGAAHKFWQHFSFLK